MKPVTLMLAGPTGVGKTAVALQLAREWGAEIVSADARQVYRGLDIGTAKVSRPLQREIRHHLIDICDPSERYSAADFARAADQVLEEIHGRGRRAIVVGGTGFYLKVLREGVVEAPPITPEVRARVDQMDSTGGVDSLREYLAGNDPHTLQAIDSGNRARLRRAVEFHMQTADSLELSRQQGVIRPRRHTFYPVVLVRPREQLYANIELRAKTMIEEGWLDEVARLSRRWDMALPAFDAVGYRELYTVIRQEVTLDDAMRQIVQRTRRYAKRQLTWFTHQGQWMWMTPDSGVTAKITSGLVQFAENESA